MLNSKRQIAFSSVLALLLYLVPNMVQDVHRVWGHHEQHITFQAITDTQFQNQVAKCPVCVFEYNIVDKIESFAYLPFLQSEISFFINKCDSQTQKKALHYYNLRAPPQA